MAHGHPAIAPLALAAGCRCSKVIPTRQKVTTGGDGMDDLHDLAEIGKQLRQLQEEHRKSMAAKDWATATDLQEKIGELSRRRDHLKSSTHG